MQRSGITLQTGIRFPENHVDPAKEIWGSLVSREGYAYPVWYSDDRPVVQFPFRDDDDVFLVSAFLVKARCWEYEKEWRLLYHDGIGEKPFRATSVDGLIFGAGLPTFTSAQFHNTSNLRWREERSIFINLNWIGAPSD